MMLMQQFRKICKITTYTFIHVLIKLALSIKQCISRPVVFVAFHSSHLSDPHYVLTSQFCVQLYRFIPPGATLADIYRRMSAQ